MTTCIPTLSPFGVLLKCPPKSMMQSPHIGVAFHWHSVGWLHLIGWRMLVYTECCAVPQENIPLVITGLIPIEDLDN